MKIRETFKALMGRQGEGGGLKILKNEETSLMDDPLLKYFFIPRIFGWPHNRKTSDIGQGTDQRTPDSNENAF